MDSAARNIGQFNLGIPMAVVDLETTGTSTDLDSITEIGVVFIDELGNCQPWSTLVNPQALISPFVESLTGITNAMVADAPLFEDIAEDLFHRLSGRLFVAHNVAFDYKVLSQAFKRVGMTFKSPRLCSVKASRALIKGLPSYSLGKLCSSLNIELNNAHRALADARATVKLMGVVQERNSREAILDLALELWRKDKLPDSVSLDDVNSLPNAPGVFRAYDSGQLIWVKAMKALSQDFFKIVQGSGPKYLLKELHKFEQIEFEETGCFEVARLIEMDQMILYKPRVNRNTIKVSAFLQKPVRDQILLGAGRKSGESSYMVVVNSAIVGYGFVDRHEPKENFEAFQNDMTKFESPLTFRSELENWLKNRKFRNIPRPQ